MKTYSLPNSDLVVSRIAFGCAMLGVDWSAPDFADQTAPAIDTAYEQGITLFDTADVYGHGAADLALGRVVGRQSSIRDTVVIQSKCGDRFVDGMIDNSAAHILSSVEATLRRIGTDYLDILLLHWPDALVEPEEVAVAFDELQSKGKVRYFGTSNHNADQIALLRKFVNQPLIVNQVQLGLGHWSATSGSSKIRAFGAHGVQALESCRTQDIHVQAYSPLRLGELVDGKTLFDSTVRATPGGRELHAMLDRLAMENDVTPAAVVIAWLLRHPAKISPILGTSKSKRVVDIALADNVEISRRDWYGLLRMASAIAM